VQIPGPRGSLAHLLCRVAQHLGIPGVQSWRSAPKGEAPHERDARAVCREANEAICLVRLARQQPREEQARADVQRIRYLEEELARAGERLARADRLARLLTFTAGSVRRPVWIWGAGAAGTAAARWIREQGGCVAGFIDSDPAKAGRTVEGLPVASPEVLPPLVDEGLRVVVASIYAADILAACAAGGVSADRVVLWDAAPDASG